MNSIGNENYGGWEMGAKTSQVWGRFVLESAMMMKHVFWRWTQRLLVMSPCAAGA